MTTIGSILVIIFSLGAFVLPRRAVPLCLLAAALYITQGQAIELGVSFMAIRFVELATFLRVVLKRELATIKFSAADRWLLIYFSASVSMFCLRTGSFDVYQFGTAVDAWLVYFSFRAMIRNEADFTHLLKCVSYLLVPFALMMQYESNTGRNLFAFMGGVPETPIMREGHYRCQGSFRHAITAGTVGATFVALYLGFLFQKSSRLWALIGIISCIVIVLASHSSGPLMATVTALTGWGCWFLRSKMKIVRRGIVVLLIVFHFTITGGAWFIFDRISGILGGDGWHRSNLIDKFISHFGEWGIAGMSFLDTSDWAATQLPWGGVDVTNYYVSIGILGGVLSLASFIALLTVCFRIIGRAGAALRAQLEPNLSLEALVWGAGCTVCAHAVNMTAVIYWDQSFVFWYLHLALAVSLSNHVLSIHRPEAAVVNDQAGCSAEESFAGKPSA